MANLFQLGVNPVGYPDLLPTGSNSFPIRYKRLNALPLRRNLVIS